MKNFLKFSLVVAIAMTSLHSFAIEDDNFLLNVKKGQGKEISVIINNIQKVTISIFDKDNNLIYTELATGKEGILKKYNLDEFPDGVYFLEVENNRKTIRQEIVIKKEVSVLTKSVVVENFKPVVENAKKIVLGY
jgi:hypothetical protein